MNRIEGYAIVSKDGMLANANGVMPGALKFKADQAFFEQGMDGVDVAVHGRHSHEGQPHSPLFGFREFLGLPVLVQLHPVFNSSQEGIGGFQLISNLLVEEFELEQPIQTAQGIRFIQLRMTPAIDELQRLHQKLHFANAAHTELHIELLRAGMVLGAFGSNAVAHGAQLIKSLKIQEASEDKRAHLLDER